MPEGSVPGPENAEGTSVPVKESCSADRSDFTIAEESTQGDRAHFLMEQIGVVVGPPVQVLTPAQA